MTARGTERERLPGDVRSVAMYHGVPLAEVRSASVQGQANLTVFLGSELVLRLPRTAHAATLLATEAVAVPLAREAGVPIAEVLVHDESLTIASVPYVVQRRMPGRTLADPSLDTEVRRRAVGSLGRALARLHRIRWSEVGDLAGIPSPYAFSVPELLAELGEAGEIGASQQAWLAERFETLRSGSTPNTDPVLVHRDVNPGNVLVNDAGDVTALVDWGLSQWGSPARDLVGLPPRDLVGLLGGYRSERGVLADDTLESEALWFHLYLALARLLKTPRAVAGEDWAAPRSATLVELLALASDPGGSSR